MLAKLVELPLGELAARLLEDIRRARELFKEIESFYKRVLEQTPGAIPGWTLEPGNVRREIPDASGSHYATRVSRSVMSKSTTGPQCMRACLIPFEACLRN